MKKYNNDSLDYSEWTTGKLKEEARSYDGLINVIECYGLSDLRMFEGILAELEKRGIELSSKLSFN